MNDVFDLMEEKDLSPDLKLFADVCGSAKLIEALRHLGGMSIYFPKVSYFTELVMRYYRANSDKPLSLIARELGVSVPYLKKQVRESRKKNLNTSLLD